ncbi:diaminopimelate epimerase [Bacillus pinisoli]|uniref:diaminopimelate epimerase n=1 Tax=Bacillus pinisoli TaxID=2901866 RepID=UPI001FF589DD|nr:diaminopimelate epimerase [Bacillus pinisoli]
MEKIPFTKMHALGNNYIYVNLFKTTIKEESLADLAVKVSSVYTGIGSDGLILICPSNNAPVKMRIFNNDGSEGKNCGNGLRCVAKYAYENGIVGAQQFKIETLSGLVEATVQEKEGIVESVTINMGKPRLSREEIPMVGSAAKQIINEPFQVSDHTYHITAVSMGNPHAIMYVDDINQAPVLTLGPIIEKDERFPESVNVEFVEVVNEKEIHFRVWERGSGVTQACGTGACAAVVASVLNGKTERGTETTVHLAGGDLQITWTESGEVFMTGPAEVICEGVYFYE